MENEKIKIGIKEIQKIKMTINEKENILKSVLNFSVPSKKPINSPYSFISIFQKNNFIFYGTLALFVIFLGSGGVLLESQKSLPGNALYSIKIGIMEPIGSALQISPNKKAQYEIALVKERIEETKTLVSSGKLDKNKEEQVNKLIESHKNAFKEAIGEIKQNEEKIKTLALAENLEQEMENNVQTLAIVTQQIDEKEETNEQIAMVEEKTTDSRIENKKQEIFTKTKILEEENSNESALLKNPNSQEILTTTEDNKNQQKYIDISLSLFTKWLKQISIERGDVLDYRINNITFIASKNDMGEKENSLFSDKDSNEAFIVSIQYSVQTTENGKNNYWLAGNGKDGENGWVLNKSIFATIDKKNVTFYIKNIGTGI